MGRETDRADQLRGRLQEREAELLAVKTRVEEERRRAERLEVLLRDREQLLSQAKEMWMKESARASSLAEQVAAVERVASDLEREKELLTEKYSMAAAEVRQLRILFNKTDAYVPLGVGSTAKLRSSGARRPEFDTAAAYPGGPASPYQNGFGSDTA